MQLLVDNTILLESKEFTHEIDQLNKYIITHLTGIYDYLNIYTERMCKITLIDNREEFDELYKEYMQTDAEKKAHTEVSPAISSFINGDNLYVLNYDAYINYFKNSKTTIDEYNAKVLADLIPIFQVWKFGKLSGNKVIDRGLAVFLAFDDVNCKVLNDSYTTLAKSDNDKAYGNFFKYLDELLNHEYGDNQMIDLLTGNFDNDRLHKIYEGYKRQFMANRSRQ